MGADLPFAGAVVMERASRVLAPTGMETQKRQLTDFLKGCRARLLPLDVGLPETNRRRTPGLRREDVAALAGVSVTWYTWLEQGRNIQVSADVLERICGTLRMSADEREYLFALVQHRPAPPIAGRQNEVSQTVVRMLAAIAVPAIVMTARWDVIAWNPLASKIFRDYEKMRPDQRNLLRILLIEERLYQHDQVFYETMVRRVLSKFRVDYSQYADDPAFQELIDDLAANCPIFRKLWNSPEVIGRSEAIAHHPQLGGMTFEHSSYVPEGSPALRVVIFVPYDAESTNKVMALLDDRKSSSAGRRRSAAKAN